MIKNKVDTTYQKAASLFMERFPFLALQLNTWTPTKIIEEDPPHINFENIEVLYVYGLGNASFFLQCKKWLEQKEKKLIFLEDDPGVIVSFLQQKIALEVLLHPQVHLELFSKKETELEALAKRFPSRHIEMIGLPSKGRFHQLRLKLLRKTALAHALYLDRLYGYLPFKNFVENVQHIPSSFYVNKLKGAFKDIPAVVCGAGPSLKESIPTLRALENKALLIAGGSTLAALSSQGILPHFGMAIDPNIEEYKRLKNSFAFEVPLIYSTRVHPNIFQTCNGPFGYMRSGIGGLLELWLEESLKLQEPLLGEGLSSESISVTTTCVAFAQFLGCNPILLNGIDMAYTQNKRYAPGVLEEETLGFKEIDHEKSAPDRILKRKNRHGKIVYTAVRWVMESSSISHFAKMYPETKFINTTEGGIGFKGIAYTPLDKAATHFNQLNLREKVIEKVMQSTMPEYTQQMIEEKMQELRMRLERVIEHLEVLAEEKKGVAALAEIELKEEIATLYLFYDVYTILQPGDHFWKEWLTLARNYNQVLTDGDSKTD